MQILQNEEEKTLIIVAELQQLKQNIEIGVAHSSVTVAHLRNFHVINNVRLSVVGFENNNSPVNPDCELV